MKKIVLSAMVALFALAPMAANAGVIISGKMIIITPNPVPSMPQSRSVPSAPVSQSPIELLTQLSAMGIPGVCVPALAESEDAYRNCSRKYARAALVNASAIYMHSYNSYLDKQPEFYGCYARYYDSSDRNEPMQLSADHNYPEEDCDVEARLDLELQLIHSLIEVRKTE